jgi:hypothetical protein
MQRLGVLSRWFFIPGLVLDPWLVLRLLLLELLPLVVFPSLAISAR